MLFELPLLADPDVVEVEIGVPPAYRRRGIGSALWRWAEARAADEGRTIFQAEVSVPVGSTWETWPGGAFAARLGFTSANVEDPNLARLAGHREDRRWLHTWTALTNGPMQKVNTRFGFRPVDRLHECERS